MIIANRIGGIITLGFWSYLEEVKKRIFGRCKVIYDKREEEDKDSLLMLLIGELA